MNDIEHSRLDQWSHHNFLEKVTNTAPGIIYIYNHQTQSNEYSNRSIGTSLGYTGDEILSMGSALFVTICHPDDLSLVGQHIEDIRQMNDGELSSIEYRVIHKNGSLVWLLGNDTVYDRNESGEVIRHLGVAIDITQQKLAEEQALAQQRAADAANMELRSFAYSISHDMKSPSTTLRLLLNEIQSQHGESLDDDAQELLSMCLNTVGRMQRLVEDVMTYTQVVGQEIEEEHVDLNVLVKDVVQKLLADTQNSGAVVLARNLPLVRGCRTDLAILLQNLISNGIKYQEPDSKPRIVISSTTSEHDDDVEIQFKDNGIGIAPEHHQRIFGLFKRLHANEDYPGTGLGLAICKRIALKHNAEISVESVVNEGSTFTVRFRK